MTNFQPPRDGTPEGVIPFNDKLGITTAGVEPLQDLFLPEHLTNVSSLRRAVLNINHSSPDEVGEIVRVVVHNRNLPGVLGPILIHFAEQPKSSASEILLSYINELEIAADRSQLLTVTHALECLRRGQHPYPFGIETDKMKESNEEARESLRAACMAFPIAFAMVEYVIKNGIGAWHVADALRTCPSGEVAELTQCLVAWHFQGDETAYMPFLMAIDSGSIRRDRLLGKDVDWTFANKDECALLVRTLNPSDPNTAPMLISCLRSESGPRDDFKRLVLSTLADCDSPLARQYIWREFFQHQRGSGNLGTIAENARSCWSTDQKEQVNDRLLKSSSVSFAWELSGLLEPSTILKRLGAFASLVSDPTRQREFRVMCAIAVIDEFPLIARDILKHRFNQHTSLEIDASIYYAAIRTKGAFSIE